MEGPRRAVERIPGGQGHPGDVAVHSGAFAIDTGTQVGTLTGGVSPHHSEVVGGREALVGDAGGQYYQITGANPDAQILFTAQAQPGLAADDAQSFVGGAVIVGIGVHPADPAAAPAVLVEEGGHRQGSVEGGQIKAPGVYQYRQARIVGESAVILEHNRFRLIPVGRFLRKLPYVHTSPLRTPRFIDQSSPFIIGLPMAADKSGAPISDETLSQKVSTIVPLDRAAHLGYAPDDVSIV
jgi:hypothetical protein